MYGPRFFQPSNSGSFALEAERACLRDADKAGEQRRFRSADNEAIRYQKSK